MSQHAIPSFVIFTSVARAEGRVSKTRACVLLIDFSMLLREVLLATVFLRHSIASGAGRMRSFCGGIAVAC